MRLFAVVAGLVIGFGCAPAENGLPSPFVNKENPFLALTVKGLRQVARDSALVRDETALSNYIAMLGEVEGIAYAMVVDAGGRVRVHTDPRKIGSSVAPVAHGEGPGGPSLPTVTWQERAGPDGAVLEGSVPVGVGGGAAVVGFRK